MSETKIVAPVEAGASKASETSVEPSGPPGSPVPSSVSPGVAGASGSGGVVRRIRNWHEFQHFKDRCPPWIKLHRSILGQRDIMTLSADSFRFLVCLWLMASEDKAMNGVLPKVEDISFRLNISDVKCCELLRRIDAFLISERYHSDAPETEKRQSREETEEKTPQGAPLTDLSFIEELKKLYTWIDFDKEQAKMKAWLLTPRGKGRKLTRAFMVRWLNKIDKTMDGQSLSRDDNNGMGRSVE